MREEDIIRKKCGNNNPFKTPEGYFDDFTERLMARLPEKEMEISASDNRKKNIIFRPLYRMVGYVAAAAVCGVMIFSAVRMTHTHKDSTAANISSQANNETSDAYINEALDYAMVSNQEITMYLTEVN